MAYRVDIMTLFPDSMRGVLGESILGRAAAKGILEINCVQIRDFTENKQKQVDDYPYGGGFGCVMMAQPLKSCLQHIMSTASNRKSRVIVLSPQGKRFSQSDALRLREDYDHLVLVCGHYEGIDERFIEDCADEEISIGDFVLTGGEIPAMALADSVCRLIPGVLSDEECFTGESHWDGLLEYPQYTRPEVWENRAVPPELLTGDHAAVARWRRKKSMERTLIKRSDLFESFKPQSVGDESVLNEVLRERGLAPLTHSFNPRRTVEPDPHMIIGIDAGGSALKLAVFNDGEIVFTHYEENGKRPAWDAIAETLDKWLGAESVSARPESIRLHITGVGAKACKAETFGLPITYVPEPIAIGRGGTFLAVEDEAVVASIGTGTALILAKDGEFTHLGGTGIGGGTILGLAGRILGLKCAEELNSLAGRGNLSAVDLTVGDLFSGSPTLPPELTAANLAKPKAAEASAADWAAGILNLCLQAVGSMATFCAKAQNTKTVVLTGAVAETDPAKKIFARFGELYGIKYLVPPNARCATAIGAALTRN